MNLNSKVVLQKPLSLKYFTLFPKSVLAWDANSVKYQQFQLHQEPSACKQSWKKNPKTNKQQKKTSML